MRRGLLAALIVLSAGCAGGGPLELVSADPPAGAEAAGKRAEAQGRTDPDSGERIFKLRPREGDRLAYTVNVVTAGTYAIDVRSASSGGGGTVHFTLDGANITGAIALPDTGGWNTWTTTTKAGVTLPAGVHVLRLVVDANGPGGTASDINWFAIR